MDARTRAGLICLFVAACLMTAVIVGTVHLKTILGNLAETKVNNLVGQVVVSAVQEAVESGDIQYDQLIHFEKDNSGAITALQSDMAEFNRLQSAITADVLERLEEIEDTELSIPIGTLSGSAFLAGRGPKLTVRMQSTGSCSARFENSFTHAGINQTTHSILLYVDVSMAILLPGFSTHAQWENAFSVAETVIVGAVPETYTYFDSGNDVQEDAYEYAINKG
jgi:sporulation protein YunB